MKIRLSTILTPLIFFGISGINQAQELVTSVSCYPNIFQESIKHQLKSTTSDTLELPFIDDFSAPGPYPLIDKWSDHFIYVNNDFPWGQPTYGVATFDMMNETGVIYEDAGISSFLADQLTSNPIDLFYPLDTTVYLSFYFQPGGLGDLPEPSDSLAVEFYAPDMKTWTRVWSVGGQELSPFKLVMIPITDSRYLQKGFRFRFVNYASLANAYEPSLKVNADQWHIDYVYLNRGRHYQDTIMLDVALIEPTGSLLLDYTAMPWEHYRQIGISGVKTIFPLHLKNLSIQRFNFTPEFSIEDQWGNGSGYHNTLQSDEIKAFEELNYDATFNYGFTSNITDSAFFTVTLNLNTDGSDWIPENNSLTYEQKFLNYYAYDDGHPEAGYGLVGEGSKSGRIAYRFENLYPGDSLVGVSILFNRSFEDANRKYFKIALWKDDAGKPGEPLWIQEGGISNSGNDQFSFQNFMLDTAQVVPSFYHVGIIQTTPDFLNIGFDRNNINNGKISYNLSGIWLSSSFEGSLMIRPLFANKSRKSGVNNNLPLIPANPEINIFPNPANSSVTLTFDPDYMNDQIIIIDNLGKIIYRNDRLTSEIQVRDWPQGIYRILVRSSDGSRLFKSSLVVLHE